MTRAGVLMFEGIGPMVRGARWQRTAGVTAAALAGSLWGAPLAGAGLMAQVPNQAATGDRLRVRSGSSAHVIGQLEQQSTDSLILRTAGGERVAIARQGITRLEVSRGRHRRMLKGGVIGFWAGATAGVAVGFALDADEDQRFAATCADSFLGCENRWFDGIEIGIGGAFGAAIGLTGGILIGSVPVESWRRLPLAARTSLRPAPRGLGVHVAF